MSLDGFCYWVLSLFLSFLVVIEKGKYDSFYNLYYLVEMSLLILKES